MKQQTIHTTFNNLGIRFRSWSRKGFAVFSSLGRVVHIGSLSVSLVQWIGELVEHVETIFLKAIEALDEEVSDLQEPEELALMPVMVSATEAGAMRNSRQKHINCRQ